MSHFKKWFRIAFSLRFKGSVKAKETRRRSFSPPLARAAFMGLKAGYNWVKIVVISVPTPVGRPKTFSIATYVALKGRLPPQGFRSRVG